MRREAKDDFVFSTTKGDRIKNHIYSIINDNYRKLISELTMLGAANQTLAKRFVRVIVEGWMKKYLVDVLLQKRFVFIVL